MAWVRASYCRWFLSQYFKLLLDFAEYPEKTMLDTEPQTQWLEMSHSFQLIETCCVAWFIVSFYKCPMCVWEDWVFSNHSWVSLCLLNQAFKCIIWVFFSIIFFQSISWEMYVEIFPMGVNLFVFPLSSMFLFYVFWSHFVRFIQSRFIPV